MSSHRHSAPKYVLVPEAAGARSGALVALDPEKLKHLRKVLRMDWGDPLFALDGAGRAFEAQLESAAGRAGVRLGTVVREAPRPPALELLIGLPKNATMDRVVEKAVECGATKITPVVSSRSVVKPPEGEEGKYVRRWQLIMDGAVEQSEHLWRPLVSAPAGWRESFGVASQEKIASFAFVSEMREKDRPESELLSSCVKALQAAQSKDTRLVIGPEGGFSEDEQRELETFGFVSVSLGSSVLRVETAAVAALTLARVIRIVSVS